MNDRVKLAVVLAAILVAAASLACFMGLVEYLKAVGAGAAIFLPLVFGINAWQRWVQPRIDAKRYDAEGVAKYGKEGWVTMQLLEQWHAEERRRMR